MDALRGGFGTGGNIIRARSMHKSVISGVDPNSPAVGQWGTRYPYASSTEELRDNVSMPGMQRHQLYDAPVPHSSTNSNIIGGGDDISPQSQRGYKSIKFGAEDTRHFYPSPGLPGIAHHDSVKKEEAEYPHVPDTAFSSQQMRLPVQSRLLLKANNPFEGPRFRANIARSTDDEGAEEVADDEEAEDRTIASPFQKVRSGTLPMWLDGQNEEKDQSNHIKFTF